MFYLQATAIATTPIASCLAKLLIYLHVENDYGVLTKKVKTDNCVKMCTLFCMMMMMAVVCRLFSARFKCQIFICISNFISIIKLALRLNFN